MPNYTLNSYQVALFPNDLQTSNIQKFLSALTGIAEYDGAPLVLPLPMTAPREIPQITLRAVDDTKQCQISFEKIYFTWSSPKTGALDVTIDQMKELISKVLEALPKGMTFKRLGFITEYIIDNSGDEILPKILNASVAPAQVTDFSVSMTKAAKLTDYENCNRIVSFQKGKRVDDPSHIVTLMQQDFNTMQDKEEKFDLSKIKTLLDQAKEESSLEKIKSSVCLE